MALEPTELTPVQLESARKATERPAITERLRPILAQGAINEAVRVDGRLSDRSIEAKFIKAKTDLVEQFEKIGLDPSFIALKLKEALEKSVDGVDRIAKDGKHYSVPDLNAAKNLMQLWGVWMGMEKKYGATIEAGGVKLGLTGLDEAGRSRVEDFIGRIQTELERRRLPDVPAGSVEVKDAAPLQRMVEVGPGEAEVVDRGAP